MKREDITALLPDITEEQLDKIMGLHGADVTNLKESLATAQNDLTTARSELTAANEKLKGYDPDWQTKMTDAQNQVGAVRRDAAIQAALMTAGARNTKAALAMLDLDKVKLGEDGKLDGLEDQLTELTKSDSWLFSSGASDTGMSTMSTGGEHGQGGTATGDGVEAAFNKLNPWHKSET